MLWLTCTMAVAVSVCVAFNIDTTTPQFYKEQKDFFTNKVLQSMSGKKKGTVVTQLNGSEEICDTDLYRTHQCLVLPDISQTFTETTTPVKHHSLLTVGDSEIAVCSLVVAPECIENFNWNTVCYSQRNSISFTPAPPDCTSHPVDLVFLFDGSGSMTDAEFHKSKEFIVDLMNSFKNTSVKFAAVQFSTFPSKVFDFSDYQAGRAVDKLMQEHHMQAITNTYKGLRFVLEEILQNPDAGASPGVTKVLVLITDGYPTDTDRYGIIKRYDDGNITRFVIMVKERSGRFQIDVASEPKERHFFRIESYDIPATQELLHETICATSEEGSEMAGELTHEISQMFLYKVCSPSVVHGCNMNSYLNSVCYNLTDNLQEISNFTPAFQDCTKQKVDLVFLFDGSGSMTEAEFDKNKDFIIDIMLSLQGSPIKFAAVQFSTDYRKVFDFNDYDAGRAHANLMAEPQMADLTNTHKALNYVYEHILVNPGAGASPDATKVLVLVTDGDPTDTDRYGIIYKFDVKKVIRFVIVLKDAKLEKFKAIASEPKDKNAFKIENYNALKGSLENFQVKIFNMEGSTVARSGNMTNEMSQSGFSAVFHKACSPSEAHECFVNPYLNMVCYHNTSDPLQRISSVTPDFEGCTEQKVDLVFLLDGSGSMREVEFNQSKDFAVDLMSSLTNSSVQFAAVQFSTDHRKVFDFTDYQAGRAVDRLMQEHQMGSLTNTHRALRFVLEEIFEKTDGGASPGATKVLVLITDGNPTDMDRYGIIKRYDDGNIICFVIAVGMFSMDRLPAIVPDENIFKIENYEGLRGIVEILQKNICQMEDSSVVGPGDITNTMAQSGFSIVLYRDILILGSVGSNSWRSYFQELHEQKQTQIDDMQIAYMGHSVSVGEKTNTTLYFTGAPTFEQTGQVVLFRHDNKIWTAAQRINGDQNGSYFGAELCSVDVNSDGNTDFLLVGAPLFHQPQEQKQGKIYVYRLTDEMRLESELNVTASSMGRFGTSISSLADLNGDGLRDVAVGAPLEDDYRGAVYIFLGDEHRGIRSAFSQRIMGQKIKPELRFFGQAIKGDVDLGEDGLPDIVIASQDTAVILRARPVVDVSVRLSLEPEEISTGDIDCQGYKNVSVVVLTGCFEMVELTKSKAASSELTISYTLEVDPTKEAHRGSFSQTERGARNVTSALNLRDRYTCFNNTIYMPGCVDDRVSPLSIRLNFCQVDSERASAVLNVDSGTQAVVEVPWKK